MVLLVQRALLSTLKQLMMFYIAGAGWSICDYFLTLLLSLLLFAYNRANTRTGVLKKLSFPNYEFGKGQYAFSPKNYLISAREKNKHRQKK